MINSVDNTKLPNIKVHMAANQTWFDATLV